MLGPFIGGGGGLFLILYLVTSRATFDININFREALEGNILISFFILKSLRSVGNKNYFLI